MNLGGIDGALADRFRGVDVPACIFRVVGLVEDQLVGVCESRQPNDGRNGHDEDDRDDVYAGPSVQGSVFARNCVHLVIGHGESIGESSWNS